MGQNIPQDLCSKADLSVFSMACLVPLLSDKAEDQSVTQSPGFHDLSWVSLMKTFSHVKSMQLGGIILQPVDHTVSYECLSVDRALTSPGETLNYIPETTLLAPDL